MDNYSNNRRFITFDAIPLNMKGPVAGFAVNLCVTTLQRDDLPP